ncbi:MAG: DUF1850 domain-containing protein [Pseudomonadota bacterium]|nr:DUF1850 domain-containing protein [Pseudomonadota bacterium]
MSLCLATAAVALQLAAPGFTLSWIHSVERTEWREHWRVEGRQLVLEQARVRGSGAGMDPGEGAVLQQGWWVWPGHRLTVPALNLANSGATVSGWTFCATDSGCHDLARWLTHAGQAPESIRITANAGSCQRLSAPLPLPGPTEATPTTPSPARGKRR